MKLRLRPRQLVLFSLLLVTVMAVASSRLFSVMRSDVRQDLLSCTWSYGRQPQASCAAFRWWPISAPLIAYWRMSPDEERRQYALSVLHALGDPGWAHQLAWLEASTLFPRPTAAQVEDALTSRPEPWTPPVVSADERLLDDLIGGPPTDAQRKRVRAIMADPANPLRARAAAVVISHCAVLPEGGGEPVRRAVLASADPLVQEATTLLAGMVSGRLDGLCHIEDPLMLRVVTIVWPSSRLARGCAEYAAVRGRPYFCDGIEEWFDNRHEAKPDRARRVARAAIEERGWRGWLDRYPDHPGADDARYWLGRTLEWQGRRAEALAVYLDLVLHRCGDGDMQSTAVERLRLVLDVAVDADDLRAALAAGHDRAMDGALRYALAVHEARRHRYAEALALTAALDLDAFAPFGKIAWELPTGWPRIQLEAQRALWQRAAAVDPTDRVALAALWAEPGGWRLGYSHLWAGMRASGLAFDTYATDEGLVKGVREGFQRASSCAVILDLLSTLPDDPKARERALYLRLFALYGEWSGGPSDEMIAMGELPSLPPPDTGDWLIPPKPVDDISSGTDALDAWYVRQAVSVARALLTEFPDSHYGQDALMTLGEMTESSMYYRHLLARWPDGRRADEARVLLGRE